MAEETLEQTRPAARHRTGALRRRLPVLILVVLAAGFLIWLLSRPDRSEGDTLTGYIQSDTLYLSSAVAGTLTSVSAERGDLVEPGERLFAIDPATLDAAAGSARAGVGEAEAQAALEREGVAAARADYQAQAAEAERARRDLAR